nr:hypothetical protein [Tanacetum cinerariifolium]
KWHDGESNKGLGRSSEDGMSVITDKLNDLGRDMRKLKESVHAIQVGCEMCGGRHLGKDCQYKVEIKSIKATGYGGTTNDIESAKHPIEESVSKYLKESSKRHDAYEEWMQRFREIIGKSLKKHDSKIKNLEKKVDQLAQAVHASMTNESKSVNQVKTVAIKSCPIIHYRSCSASLDSNMVLCTSVVPNLIEQENVKKTGEGDESPRPTPIIGLGNPKHVKMLIEMADKSIQSPKGMIENVLVKIGKFIFPLDFVILDIVEDDKVLIILGRPMLATAHAKIDVFGKKISLEFNTAKGRRIDIASVHD